jgi:hypothetical protein
MADSSVPRVGKPLKYKTVEALEQAIEAYFAECDPHIVEYPYIHTDPKTKERTLKFEKRLTEQEPYTMSGLAYALDMDRRTLLDYSKRDRYLPTIKKARNRVEKYVEKLMLKSNGVVAGVIFNAKNNFGWQDKIETDITTNGKDLPTPILGGLTKRDVPTDDSAAETR